MKWEKLLSKSFLFFLVGLLLISIAALTTPFWIPRVTTLSADAGTTGDAIGGITSPFITLIMAILAFFAFWMQYQTLRDQRREMNRHHFEERLSLMLSRLCENANSLKAGTFTGREAAEELAGEYYLSLTSVLSIIDALSEDIKNVSSLNDQEKAKLTLYYNEITSTDILKQEFVAKTAYGIFSQGLHFTPNAVEKQERVWLTALIEARISNRRFDINVDKRYSEILFNDSKDLSEIKELPYEPFKGHNAELGCYYRHLYQIVHFIASYPDDEMTEDEKYGYAKLVRSHLSDYEQFLLYYNTLSDFGKSWNTPLTECASLFPMNMGMISRFRMIKNVPGNIYWRGLNPVDRCRDAIVEWKRVRCDFFETPQFLSIE